MVKEEFLCSLCGKPFKDYRSNHRKFCGIKCSHKHQSNVRSAGEEHRAIRKIWNDMRRYAHTQIGGFDLCDVDMAWDYSFSLFYQWAVRSGYTAGAKFSRKDKSIGYIPSNCHFIKGVVPS